MKVLKVLFLLLSVAILGCETVPVAEDIPQTQATEVVAALTANGIAARAARTSSNKDKYSVSVEKEDYSPAVTILSEQGLLKKPEPTFSDLIAQQGLLPNSREIEALRFDRAQAAQLEEMLQAHPSVAAIRAVVRSSSPGAIEAPPSVSIVIQKRPGTELAAETISAIVAKALPLIPLENIMVSISEKAPERVASDVEGAYREKGRVLNVPLVPFLFGWRVPRDDYNGLALTLVGFLILVISLGAMVGYWLGYYQQARQLFDNEAPENPFRLKSEPERKNLPEA